jgi:hypothetical protein
MPGNNSYYDQLEAAHAKLAMLSDSCTAISRASEGWTEEFRPGLSWFEGAAQILQEARETTGGVLCDYGDELKEAPEQ